LNVCSSSSFLPCFPIHREAFLQLLYQSLFPKLSPHELHETVTPICAMETTQVSSHPPTTALELAHRVAFRNSGLGNSLFASADEPVSVAQVSKFFYEATRKNPITLIGTGLNHQKLENIAESFFGRELNHDLTEEEQSSSVQSSEAYSSKSKLYGGEERQPIDLHLLPQINPTMLISFGSLSTTLSNSPAEAAVIPHLLGGVSSIKWAPSSSPLSKSVASVEGSYARAHTSIYSDASLLNIEVQAEGSKRLTEAAKKVVESVKALAKEKISSEALKVAIAKAKFEIAAASETSTGVVDIAAPMVSLIRAVALHLDRDLEPLLIAYSRSVSLSSAQLRSLPARSFLFRICSSRSTLSPRNPSPR
jgi:ubiquinol-cytochrome c reductase core subunit 2